MADIQTPYSGITGTHKGFDSANGMNVYEFTNPVGEKVEYRSVKDLDQMRHFMKVENYSKDKAANSFSSDVLRHLMSGDQRGFLDRVVFPNLRALPANIAGLGPEVASLLTFIPGPDDLVMAPFKEGDDWKWWETKGAKELRKTMKPLGVEQQRKRFEQWARMGEKYLRAQGLSDEVNPLSVLGTDMTPEEQGWIEKAVSMAMEFGLGGAGEVKAFTEGAGAIQWLTRQARDLVKAKGEKALDKENIESLIDKARNYYSVRSKAGWQHLGAEVGFGATAGAASAGALAALESADPEAADWLKAITAIGAGILGPVTAKTGITGFFLLPGVKLARKVTDPLFFPASSAARFQQQHGGQSPAQVARVHDILALAVRENRHLDKAAGLAFTTPELARAEAARIRVMLADQKARLESPAGKQMDDAAKEKVAADIERLEGEYLDLNQYANFQEAVYRAAFQSETAPKFWARESKRLIERRNSFFNAIDNTFRKGMDNINFGGKSGGTDVELKADYESARNKGNIPEFEATRRRLIEESDPQGIAANEMKFLTPDLQKQVADVNTTVRDDLQKVLDDAHLSVEKRVANFTEALDGYAASKGLKSFDDLSDHEKQFAGRVIRDMYKDADREFRAFEKAAFSRVKGLKDPVTENIRFPEGSKDPLGNDVSGFTVEEFASNYIENLSRQEKFATKHVPVELAHLVGRRTLLQALKRQDPESDVRQTLISHIEAEIKQKQNEFASLGKKEAKEAAATAKEAAKAERKSVSEMFGKLPTPGMTLLEFIASQGGVRDIGGDMSQLAGDWNKGAGSGKPKLVHPAPDAQTDAGMFGPGTGQKALGVDPDEARRLAAEAGYIGDNSPGVFKDDMDGFYKAVDAEVRGEPVRTQEGADRARAINEQGDVVEDLLKRLEEINTEIRAQGGVEIPEFHAKSKRRRSTADVYRDVQNYEASRSQGLTLEDTFDAVIDVELSPSRAEIARELQDLQAERIKLEKDEFGEVLSFADDVEGLNFNLGESGRLTSRTAAGDLISEGVSAGDVSAVISDIQENIRREGAKAVPNERRIANLRNLRQTLEQLLTPENFPNLDPQQLRFARDASMVRHRAQEAMGDVLTTKPTGGIKVKEELVAGTVLPSATKAKQAAQVGDVRMVETAAAKFSDDLVTFERTTRPDGSVILEARINEAILQPNTRLFEMDESPFEMRKIGTDQVDFEVRIKEGYLPSPQAIDTVENALLEQLSTRFPKGVKPEDISGVEKFRQEYDHALKWLKRHAPDQKKSAATFVDDLDSLNVQLEAINGLRTDKMRQRLVSLKNQGALAEGFDVDDYLQYIGDRQVKIAGDKALQDILRSDPGLATRGLMDRILNPSNTRTKQEINEFLSVLKNNKQAMEGFQNAFIGDLFRRSSVKSSELMKAEGITATMFEPEKFRALISDPKMRTALQEVFPDNPDLLPGLEKLAEGAAEVGPYGLGTARGGAAVRPEDFFQKEVWSNLGRILGIWTSKKTGLANELWAAGTGGRLFRRLGEATAGNVVKDMVVEAALNPEMAVAFSKDIVEFGTLGGLAKKYIIQNLNIPMEVLERARKTPGALMEILTYPTQEMEEEEVSAVAPAPSRAPQVAALNLRPPQQGSLLDKVKFLGEGGGGMGARTTAPGTRPRGQEVFGAMDPVFANQGGLVSLCPPKKPRQMVS